MSRKSEEIKLRLTPDEKASWQEAAELEQTTVSEMIRRLVNEESRQQRTRAHSLTGPLPIATLVEAGYPPPIPVASPQEDVPQVTHSVVGTLDEVGAQTRRFEPCACGKPPYVFCRTCDA